ncbi:MAG: TraB/GumN family protein [Bacteroidales bacterium]|nr:TraB/GumN family protein [Bacteroidales bacterium]
MKKTFIAVIVLTFTFASAQAQLLYKISGNGLEKPSYIVGTYHLAPAEFAEKIPGLNAAFESCDQVYGEIDMRETSKPEKQLEMQQKQVLPDGKTLTSLLTGEQLNKLNALLREVLGKDLNNEAFAAQMNRLSPALVSNTIMLYTYAKDNPALLTADQSKLIDGYFQFAAAEKGKAVKGFETADFQMEALFGNSIEQQVEDLMCIVENYRETTDMAEFVTEAYFSQDLDQLQDLSEDEAASSCGSSPEDSEKLIYDRNADWVKAMPAIMKEKPTFFAVGAMHLCGERGVLALLKEAGYTVEAVK